MLKRLAKRSRRENKIKTFRLQVQSNQIYQLRKKMTNQMEADYLKNLKWVLISYLMAV